MGFFGWLFPQLKPDDSDVWNIKPVQPTVNNSLPKGGPAAWGTFQGSSSSPRSAPPAGGSAGTGRPIPVLTSNIIPPQVAQQCCTNCGKCPHCGK